MKKIIIMLITILFWGMAGIAYAQTWQETLEKAGFDIVSTFDDLQDWTGTISQDWNPEHLPKKLDGSPSIWSISGSYAIHPGRIVTCPWIGNYGHNYVWNGSKSLRMSFENFVGSSDGQYGPESMGIYFGDGTNTSGKSEVYVFYMLKFHHDRIDISSPPYNWKPSGVNNEYYLQKNGGDPGLKMPNTLIIDGIWVDDPLTFEVQGLAVYDTRDDKIGSLGDNKWAYGDKNNLGYETIYIRLAGGADPNGKGNNYIQYENGFFTQNSKDEFNWVGVIKHMWISSGFVAIRAWRDSGGDAGCIEQNKCVYGTNFQIWNIGSEGLTFKDQVNLAKWTGICWEYEHVVNDRYHTPCTVKPSYQNDQWIGVEYRVSIGHADTADGSSDVWLYDSNGNVIGHDAKGPEVHLRNFPDFKYNKIVIGGNKLGTTYNYDKADSWENRYYIDDFIINDGRIGPTYFALVKNQPVIITSSLFEAIVNQSYSHIVQATGGMTPYTWQITAGSLPQDLILDENTGEISGVPVNEGLWTFTIEVTDAESKTASRELSLTVTATGITGDINDDGVVNVLDVQLCVNVVLGIEAREEIVNKARQVTAPEEECNVLDVQAVVNEILNSV